MILAAADQPGDNTSFATWATIVVAIIIASATISATVWNTRGESGALRRLKAMNEALEGLPSGEPVAIGFAAARDVLAQKIAYRITGPSVWKRIAAWAAGAALGIAAFFGALWLVSVVVPSGAVWSREVALGMGAALGTTVATIVATRSAFTARRAKSLSDAQDQLSRNIGEMLIRYSKTQD